MKSVGRVRVKTGQMRGGKYKKARSRTQCTPEGFFMLSNEGRWPVWARRRTKKGKLVLL